MKHPAFKKECKNLAPIMGMGGESKDEFLKTVHGSRFISMHLLFDSREALWINIPYRNNEVVSEKVWANWISDPEYMDIMREEDGQCLVDICMRYWMFDDILITMKYEWIL